MNLELLQKIYLLYTEEKPFQLKAQEIGEVLEEANKRQLLPPLVKDEDPIRGWSLKVMHAWNSGQYREEFYKKCMRDLLVHVMYSCLQRDPQSYVTMAEDLYLKIYGFHRPESDAATAYREIVSLYEEAQNLYKPQKFSQASTKGYDLI